MKNILSILFAGSVIIFLWYCAFFGIKDLMDSIGYIY